jgi:hypothetical protein
VVTRQLTGSGGERERVGERERARERGGERERERVCVLKSHYC